MRGRRGGRICCAVSCRGGGAETATANRLGVAGKSYPAVNLVIEADRVADFARAVGADPESGVPPTFAAVYSLGATAPQLFGDAEANIDFDRLLHAEQAFEWARHPRLGEEVTSKATVLADTSRRGIRMVTFETETTDSGGDRVCRSRSLFVIRS